MLAPDISTQCVLRPMVLLQWPLYGPLLPLQQLQRVVLAV